MIHLLKSKSKVTFKAKPRKQFEPLAPGAKKRSRAALDQAQASQ